MTRQPVPDAPGTRPMSRFRNPPTAFPVHQGPSSRDHGTVPGRHETAHVPFFKHAEEVAGSWEP